ncbi:hypothetical protein HanPI659440_Chr17g0664821 [Helianthus annuus]|nr:hypothetical protein HanPI659440_Chr17g0664821 [Helianthus annuus]
MLKRPRAREKKREFNIVIVEHTCNIQFLDIVRECVLHNLFGNHISILSVKTKLDRRHFGLIIAARENMCNKFREVGHPMEIIS